MLAQHTCYHMKGVAVRHVQADFSRTAAKATKLACGMRGVLILARIVDTVALPMSGGKDDLQAGICPP